MNSQAHALIDPKPFRWTKARYYEMVELGWFDGKRVELIRGQIIENPPLSVLRFATMGLVNRILTKTFDEPFFVAPGVIDLSFYSEPEPDLAVYLMESDFGQVKPRTAVLAVEIADTSLELDRTVKAELYATANIPEYWIVNVRARKLEVHRLPVAGDEEGYGAHYDNVVSYGENDVITPLAVPDARIKVASLLAPPGTEKLS